MPPIVVRRQPHPAHARYGDYYQELREDFLYSCSYCSIAEIECTPENYEVDHYHPLDQGGSPNNYGNLHFACEHCNNLKRGWWPNAQQLALGLRFIACDNESPDEHLKLNGDILEDITAVGKFNRIRLELNRTYMRTVRRTRAELYATDDITRQGLRTLARARIDELKPETRSHLMKLRARLEAEEKAIGLEEEQLLKMAGSWGPGEPERAEAAAEKKERAEYLRSARVIGTPRETRLARLRIVK